MYEWIEGRRDGREGVDAWRDLASIATAAEHATLTLEVPFSPPRHTRSTWINAVICYIC